MSDPFSLWLLPPPDEAARLTEIIDKLSRRFQTLPFQPHVTLSAPRETSEIQALQRTRSVCSQIPPISICLDNTGVTDAYFRCVFFRARLDADLLTAHRIAAQTLNGAYEPDFMPHLSLIYSDGIPRAAKEAVAHELRSLLPIMFVVETVALAVIAGPENRWRVLDPIRLAGTTR